MLDYLNTPYAQEHLIPHSQKEIDGVIFTLTRWSDQKNFYKQIHIEDPLANAPLEYTEKVARFSVDDFKNMFSLHGLQVREIFGDYELAPYDPVNSPRLLLVAQK